MVKFLEIIQKIIDSQIEISFNHSLLFLFFFFVLIFIILINLWHEAIPIEFYGLWLSKSKISIVSSSSVIWVVFIKLILVNAERVQNSIKENVNLICGSIPSFGLQVSSPSLGVFISIQTILLYFTILMNQLVFSIVLAQYDWAATMVTLAMVPDWDAVLAWHLIAE